MGQDDSARNDRERRSLHAENVGEGQAAELHSIEVKGLTLREKALVFRRRLEISQGAMAAICGVHREAYGQFERDEGRELNFPAPAVEPLEDHEKCFIHRRRSGWTQEACASRMGITRYWFNLMELGKAPCELLVKFWGRDAG